MEACKCCGEFLKSKCKTYKNARQSSYRSKNNNEVTKRYEKTLKGYLTRTYRNMLSRVKGIVKNKAHLYKGLEILAREDFYKWSIDSNYPELLKKYEESCYDRKLAPSVDRKDPLIGYTLDNIRWVTFSENCSNTRNNKLYRSE